MHSNPELVELLRRDLASDDRVAEVKMFGGIGYLLNRNMCCGVYKDSLILRVGQDAAEGLLAEPGCGPMDLTGRVMKGWVMAQPSSWRDEATRKRHVDLAVRFAGSLPPKL